MFSNTKDPIKYTNPIALPIHQVNNLKQNLNISTFFQSSYFALVIKGNKGVQH